jgi:predicted AAA+ superfamily ATPase
MEKVFSRIWVGYDVKAFNNGGKEIDFRASKDGKVYYIQVAYSVADPKAYQREFDAFKGLDDLNQRVLITKDPFDYSTSTVRHIRFADFLLMNDLQ